MTEDRGEPLLAADGLRVVVPGSHAVVDGVTFTLHRGEVLGLVGESGSGKTTVALALLGYARRGMELQGSVRVDGTDMISASERHRREIRGRVISYVPQDPIASLNPTFRIGDQLHERLRAHDQNGSTNSRERIAHVLEQMQLPATREFLRRYPHQLSGGQVQRVCIALAVLCRPQALILDEPTTGLDVMTQAHVLELVHGLIAAERTSAVYVTHDLAVVAGLADRLAVMYSGLFLEEGSADTLLRDPLHPYTRRLIQSTPDLRARKALVGIGGDPLNPKDRKDACPFAPRCEFAVPACTATLPALHRVNGHLVRCARAAEFVDGTMSNATLRVVSPWSRRAAATATPLVEVENLCASYGSNEVLRDIQLSVAEGECVALAGESGSGKTTLGRCISGLHVGTATGTLRFEGSDIPLDPRKRTPEVRRAVQYVFQSPYASLNPRHTVARSIALPLETFGLGGPKPHETVRGLLSRVRLDQSYESRLPVQMSGGERQRVAIARALAAQPRVLVCDEVTSALDVSIQASILELLGELRREMDLTIIFITHHLALVRTIADRAVVMRDGVIVEEGAATDVLDHPREDYTRELIDSTPVLVAREAAAAGIG